jgi:hypothetical protein
MASCPGKTLWRRLHIPLPAPTTQHALQVAGGIVCVVVIGVIGTRLMYQSRAAAPFASVQAESGTLSGAAAEVSDGGASSGAAVQFGTLPPPPPPPPSPTASLTANPSSISQGQSSTLSWTSTNTTSCSAAWTSSKATSGSQSVTPGATTTYSITCSGAGGSASSSATVTVASGGGACNIVLSGSQTKELLGNTVHLQSNEWGSSAPFSICTDGNADFKITNSQINNSLSGAPGAYPSLYKGCHWGYCTTNSGLPVPVSAMIATPNKVTTTYSTTVISSGAWDDAYDNWYNPNVSTNNNSTGLESMIWINHHGSIQPAGSVVSNNTSIDGMSWTVWHGGSSPGGTVSYVLNTPTTAVTNLDLGPFTADSLHRGYITNTWYLIDVEAGFEPWQGGTGLGANAFGVTVN